MNHQQELGGAVSGRLLREASSPAFKSIDAILDRMDQRQGELAEELRRSEVARLRVEAAIHDLMGLLDFADTHFEDLEPEGNDEPMLGASEGHLNGCVWGHATTYGFSDECEIEDAEEEDDDPAGGDVVDQCHDAEPDEPNLGALEGRESQMDWAWAGDLWDRELDETEGPGGRGMSWGTGVRVGCAMLERAGLRLPQPPVARTSVRVGAVILPR
jgi:hypothetical protein